MSNARNSHTTHPRKAARRERAAQRFTIMVGRFMADKKYAAAKQAEANALGLNWEAYI